MSQPTARKLTTEHHHESPAETIRRLRARVAELERLTQALERESREKSLYLASLSHEMKAPLNAINGFAELLADTSYGSLDSEQQRFVSRIAEAGQHLLGLINDVIDIARIDAGRLQVDVQPVRINRAIEQVALISRGLAREYDVSLRFDPDPADPLVLADDRRLKQVLFNLISNASKYSGAGSVVRVHSASENGHVRVSVTDQGVGIRPEDQKRVFEPFERTEAATRMADGTGLGLPLSRRLVELQGGEMGVISKPGEGSTFWFTLPIVHETSAPSQDDLEGAETRPTRYAG
ncbi:MAG: HAMP domain-containing histidine kinase [Armatimonadetes bacterium]|nr:HAMP domain-containing histidine kinase [Armatimonadota bacterium]